MTLGKRITMIRSIRGMNQGELALAMDICKSVICRWEKDDREPYFSAVEKMAKVLNCSLLDFATPGPEGLQISLTIAPPKKPE